MNKRHNTKKGTFKRLIKTLFSFYPVLLPVTLLCIIISALVSSVPSIFMQKVLNVIEMNFSSGDWQAAMPQIISLVSLLVVFYVIGLLCSFIFTQLMAVITQGSLKKLRVGMFTNMQYYPIKFFDTNQHGDIMSFFTNDIETLKQLISQSIPQFLVTLLTVTTIFFIMIYYSLWLTLVVLFGVFIMMWIISKIGGNSAKYFIRQQRTTGKVEGFIEEIINGQKVVKSFNHETASKQDFDEINLELFNVAKQANIYSNVLAPILNNIGNILYVCVAVVGSLLLLTNVENISLSGLALNISIVVPFLNMTRQFAGNIGQVSHQINSVVMGLAGASRIFELLDESKEEDNGLVTLVKINENAGNIVETDDGSGVWAWKKPLNSGFEYVKLAGDVVFENVNFGYVDNHLVLHDINIFAKPGQKIALVGATGAGKTTITNLLNRFYDINSGSIYYDGISIDQIKKDDLRKSLGIVLQDTNLFSGTVMDNIRYGRLDASDEECIIAARLVGAHDFITRLPDGYNTLLNDNGSNLSQGQRQLISIARVAVADPPVMILDEATSSIDTHTEIIVQRGMDALMVNRTVFVIAHRLSTIKNSDVIMVLDHGRIIERGNHEQLLELKGQYYQLYTGAFELE